MNELDYDKADNTVYDQINHSDVDDKELNNEDDSVDNDNDDNNNIELEDYCIICNEEAVIDDNHDLYNLYPSCRHSTHFGTQCLKQYISGKIQDSAINNLCCPLPGCKQRLNEKLIQKLSTDQEFQKYQEDMKSLTVNSNWNNIKRVGIFFQDIFANVQQLFRRVSLDSKRCPKCRYIIEKDGGCNHMTCRKCSFEFHWCCGQNYSHEHYTLMCNFIRFVLPTVAIATPLLLVCKLFLSSIISYFYILNFSTINIVHVVLLFVGSILGACLLDNQFYGATWYPYAFFYAAVLTVVSWLETCYIYDKNDFTMSTGKSICFRTVLILASSTILEFKQISDFVSMNVIDSLGGVFSFITLMTLASFATGSKLLYSGCILLILDHSLSSKYRRSSREYKNFMACCKVVLFIFEVFDMFYDHPTMSSMEKGIFGVTFGLFIFSKCDPEHYFLKVKENHYFSTGCCIVVGLVFCNSCIVTLNRIVASSITNSMISFITSSLLGMKLLVIPTLKLFDPLITYGTIPLIMLMMNPIRRDVLFGRFSGTGKIDQITSKIVSLLYLVFLYTISARFNAGVYEKYMYMSINLVLDYIYTKMKMEKFDEKHPTSAWNIVDRKILDDWYFYIFYLIFPTSYKVALNASLISTSCFSWFLSVQPILVPSLIAIVVAVNVYYFTYVR